MRATIHHGRWLACKITTNLNNYTTFSKPISFATSRSLSVISVYSITTRIKTEVIHITCYFFSTVHRLTV